MRKSIISVTCTPDDIINTFHFKDAIHKMSPHLISEAVEFSYTKITNNFRLLHQNHFFRADVFTCSQPVEIHSAW